MKFFGWGKSKEPQPQVLQQINKPDPRSGSHGNLDRCPSGMGSIMPSKGSTGTRMRRNQQGLFGGHDKDETYLKDTPSTKPHEARNSEADSEEKLQDKIRFVFSHEREGLLAIGTFALEQLQSLRNTIDGRQQGSDPSNNNNNTDIDLPEQGFGSGVRLLSLDDDIMQSSDDEDQLSRSWLAARRTCDLPVFGDPADAESEAELDQASSADVSKALALYKPDPNLNPSSENDIPTFILAAELQKMLQHPARAFMPHWTDSVPPPVIIKMEPDHFDDDDYYSTRLCGLLTKKKSLKSERSKRKLLINSSHVNEEKTRLIPIEQAQRETTKSSFLRNFASPGVAMPSLGKLARLWKASCTPSSARIAPERNVPSPPLPQPPLGAKVSPSEGAGGGRNRVQTHERPIRSKELGEDGRWVIDDEDCEFATFLFNTGH